MPGISPRTGDLEKLAASVNNLKPIPPTAQNAPQPASATVKEIWLDKQEVLQRLHISSRTLQTWRSKKLLNYSKIGGKIFYRESDLQKLLEENMK